MAECDLLKYEIDVCDDDWIGCWMDQCPSKDPYTVVYWYPISSGRLDLQSYALRSP